MSFFLNVDILCLLFLNKDTFRHMQNTEEMDGECYADGTYL